jgi:flavin reductase (DIM6/NTAB) family NADH-FMN oxidoreductase RutF
VRPSPLAASRPAGSPPPAGGSRAAAPTSPPQAAASPPQAAATSPPWPAPSTSPPQAAPSLPRAATPSWPAPPTAPPPAAGWQPGEDGAGQACDAQDFRELMRQWPTGVTVVTAAGADGPAGCTVTSVMCGSLAPPLLVVALAKTSSTLAVIAQTQVFGVNVLGAGQGELGRRFARGSRRDRFHRLDYQGRGRPPVLPGVLAAVVCTVHDTVPCGGHMLIMGSPVWSQARRDGLPLVRFRSGYAELAALPRVRP